MTTAATTNETMKVAVRCDACKRVVAYKLSTTSGHLQLKCPKCSKEIKVDLSLRRSNVPIYFRTTTYPISLPIR